MASSSLALRLCNKSSWRSPSNNQVTTVCTWIKTRDDVLFQHKTEMSMSLNCVGLSQKKQQLNNYPKQLEKKTKNIHKASQHLLHIACRAPGHSSWPTPTINDTHARHCSSIFSPCFTKKAWTISSMILSRFIVSNFCVHSGLICRLKTWKNNYTEQLQHSSRISSVGCLRCTNLKVWAFFSLIGSGLNKHVSNKTKQKQHM